MCADTSRGAAVRDLIAKVLKGPLAPAQQEVLLLSLFLFAILVMKFSVTIRSDCASFYSSCYPASSVGVGK